MLVAGEGFVGCGFVRGFYPVPAAVAVAPQSPRVLESRLVCRSTAKSNHHSGSGARRAQSSRVVGTNARLISFLKFEGNPREGSLVNIEHPHVIDGLGPSVATENNQVRLREDDGVAISAAGSLSNDWHNHPLCGLVSISEIK